MGYFARVHRSKPYQTSSGIDGQYQRAGSHISRIAQQPAGTADSRQAGISYQQYELNYFLFYKVL